MLIDKATKAIAYGSTMIDKVYYGATYIWGRIKAQLVAMSGSRMELLNVAKESELVDFKLYGKSEQKQYQGTNLFDYKILKSALSSTMSIINNMDGSFTLNGTQSRYYGISSPIALDDLTNYYVSCENYKYTTDFRVRAYRIDGDFIDFRIGRIITTDSTIYSSYGVYIQCEPNNSYDNQIIYPMLTKGTIKKPYEPYVGGIPSPSPDFPQGIKSVTQPSVTVSADGHTPQTYQFPYTLHGIPVTSGGNYTDESGQQWIADYVDVEEKKLWRMCIFERITRNKTWYYSSATNRFYFVDRNYIAADKRIIDGISNMFVAADRFDSNKDHALMFVNDTSKGVAFRYKELNGDLDLWKSFLDNNEVYVCCRIEPSSKDLTDAEVAAFKQLKTIVPTTVVSNDAGAHMEAKYWCDLDSLEAQITSLYNNDIKELMNL